METAQIISAYNLNLFVREIFLMESQASGKRSSLPFYADGCPGIIFCLSDQKAFRVPRKKELSQFFLYGQTIEPIELAMNGPYLLIVFQLYPFTSKLLFDVDPKKLNDDCYDLSKLRATLRFHLLDRLKVATDNDSRLRLLAEFISTLAMEKSLEDYREIQSAVQMITDRKGLISVAETALLLNVSERTLQRRFKRYIGISPKKFAKIIQFQTSIDQISAGTFSKLTDVVYENGYADQSHFIRNIKKFTAKKPSQLKSLK